MLRGFDLLGRRVSCVHVQRQSFANILHKRLGGGGTKLPEPGVGNLANVLFQAFRRPQPAFLSTGFCPKIIGRGRVPGGHVDSVGHVSDRDFVLRPARKQRQKEAPADLPVQAAYAIHRAAPADGQIRHVERLRRVGRVLAAQGQQIVKRNAELLFGIPPKVLLDEGRIKTVKAGGHRRVGGEEITRSCNRQRHFEGLPGLFHEVAGTFQDGERRVPFIQVTDLRLDPERAEQPPSADPEEQFLLEAQIRPAPVKFAGNPPMNREVRRVIAVQQVKLHPAHLDLPGAQPDRVSRQRDLQPQPLPVRLAQGRDRQLSGIVIRDRGPVALRPCRSPGENSPAGRAVPRRPPAHPDRWRL